MRIAVVDCRWNERAGPEDRLAYRATLLSGALQKENREIRCFQQIQNQQIQNQDVEKFTPDLVVLHVGDDQEGWTAALKELWKDRFVVCYTGGTPPQECLDDVKNNPKHAYYRDPVIDEQAAKAIARFVDEIEDILRSDPGAQSPEAARRLEQAKQALMGFDPILEAKLELLYGLLEGRTIAKCLQDPMVARLADYIPASSVLDSFCKDRPLPLEELAQLRDQLLPDEPEWAHGSP